MHKTIIHTYFTINQEKKKHLKSISKRIFIENCEEIEKTKKDLDDLLPTKIQIN